MKRKSILVVLGAILSLLMGSISVYGAAGDLLWEKTITPPAPYIYVSATVSLSSNLCVISGIFDDAFPPNTSVGFIKVYDISTGNLKWQRVTPTILGTTSGYNLILDGNILYIIPLYSNITPTEFGAYNANNGQLLWEKTASYYPNLTMNRVTPPPDNKLFVISPSADRTSANLKVYQVQNVTSPAVNSLLFD